MILLHTWNMSWMLYKRPYDKDFSVVCMDESPKQLIEEARESLPIKPGQEARVDYEYIRHGVVNIFMANEPLMGKRMVEITEFKTKKDWAGFIKKISDDQYPDAKRITLVMDNFKTHDPSALYETFEPEEAKRLWDRLEFVFIPQTWKLAEYGRDRAACFKWTMFKQTHFNRGASERRS